MPDPAFARAVADPALARAFSDPAFARAIADPALTRAMTEPAFAKAVADKTYYALFEFTRMVDVLAWIARPPAAGEEGLRPRLHRLSGKAGSLPS